MIIKRLKVDNFRNYEKEELTWDEKLNLLYGMNAQGKSNLLEAVSYLGIASSFRGAPEQDLIRFGQPYFYLEADIVSEKEGPLRISAAANRSRQRRWTVNRAPRTRLTDLVGLFHTVIFAPEDIALVKDGPEARRRYLNRQMSQLDREFCRCLMDYNHVLRQRNACLKAWEEHRDADTLESWSEQLLSLGGRIALFRQHTVEQLFPIAAEIHHQLSGGEELSLRYLCSATGKSEVGSAEEAESLYRAELQRLARSEQIRGMTLAGPHRDELGLFINGRSAKEYSSQGQQRTAALSLKLAELELARQIREEYPVLLLDDVLSELDAVRRKQILAMTLDKTQTFITATEGDFSLKSGKKWRIEDGKVFS